MKRYPAVAIVLGVTAVMVVVPVLIQVAREGYRLRQVWGYLVLGAGMLLVAAAYGLYADVRQAYLAVAGLVLAVVGMLVQHRRRE